MGKAAFTPAQNAYRFYQDGTESGSTPFANQNTAWGPTLTANVNFGLRILIQETGGADGATTDDYQLQYSTNGGGAWNNVTGASSVVVGFNSGSLTDGNATTNRGTNGITDGTGSFVAGEICEDGLLDDRQLTTDNFTEHLWSCTLVKADVSNGLAVTFRVLVNGGTMVYNVTPTINVTINPLLTQAEAAFYEDGTEAGSTVIDSGADSITRDVSSDSNILLRIRLQETNGGAGASTDDYQLQYSLNAGDYLPVDQTITGALDQSQTSDNIASGDVIGGTGLGSDQAKAQSFTTAFAYSLTEVKLKVAKVNSPTDNLFVEIRSGSTTGSLLATSDNVAGTGLSATATVTTFTFSSPPSLSDNTKYYLVVERSGVRDNSNYYRFSNSNASSYPDGGQYSRDVGSWTSESSTVDLYFQTLGSQSPGTAVIGFASTNLTDGNATTNRLGSGSGSFVAGEISEDGLVDNLAITASNYTELLYALTIESTAVEDGDTLDFRVLRNSATTGMTYTVVPRITVEQGNELMETLSDNFDDNSIDTGKWTNNAGADIVEQNQQLELTTDTTAAYKNITAVDYFDLTGSYAHVQIIDEGNQAQTSFEFYPFQLNLDGDNSLFWLITNTSLLAYKKVATTATQVYSATFNDVTHSRVRIREEAGDTYWDTFDSGTGTWTNRHTEANPIDVTALQPLIMVGTYDDEGATTTAIVDNFNIAPVTGGVKDIIGMGIIPFAR